MSNEWIYQNDFNNTVRYVLGTSGLRPLICIGINPSTAVPDDLDDTLTSVAKRALYNGFDSWIMLNVYPYRATNPDLLPNTFDPILHERNLNVIRDLIKIKNATIWVAWGTLINKRNYLKPCLHDLFNLLLPLDCNWVSFGSVSKDGHPHHPLYVKDSELPIPFNTQTYFDAFTL